MASNQKTVQIIPLRLHRQNVMNVTINDIELIDEVPELSLAGKRSRTRLRKNPIFKILIVK